MKTKLLCMVAAGAALSLVAGEDLATSVYGGVQMDTSGKAIILSSPSDIATFAARSVTYRTGETVTAIAPGGVNTALVESAAADGGVSFSPTTGGLWHLVNSNGGSVYVGVAWDVFGDVWSLDFVSSLLVKAHTIGDGPDRKLKKCDAPPVAYSGDNWIGALSAPSVVTLISPSGYETELDFVGTGSQLLAFDKPGQWTVRLTAADATREAVITIVGGFVLTVR